MTKNLNPYYEKIIDELARDGIDRYLDYIKQKPRTVLVDNLIIDAEQLDCHVPCGTCGPHKKGRLFCCKDLIVELSQEEIERIKKINPALLERYPQYRRWHDKKGGFAGYDKSFQLLLHKKSDETCIFWQRTSLGGICIIHDYCLHEGLDGAELKPMVCCLYPVMVYVVGNEVLIGLIGEESRDIMEMPDEGKMCAQSKGRAENHLVRASENILVKMFGQRAYRRIRKEVLGE